MPIDPRTLGTPPASPGDTPSLSPAIIAGIIQTNVDLNRRVAALEAARTQIGAQTITGGGSAGMLQNGSIVAASIVAGNVVASIMSAGAVNAGHIDASSIRASVISATAIVSDGLQTEWLNATHASVGTLGAITSNMGTITAGSITGATIQTALSGSRTVMDSSGLRGYALDGVTKVFEINTGTGIASFTGVATLNGSSVVPGGTISGDNTVPGSRIVSASVNTLQLNAGAVTANIVAAGAITAQKLSIAGGVAVPVPNGTFSEANPTDGTVLANNWATVGGGVTSATVQTDTIWGRTARIVHGATNGITSTDQFINLPVGRHIIRGWTKLTSVTGTGARVSALTGGTATATLTLAAQLTGTSDWQLQESVADVTVAGTVRVRLQVNGTGTAEFANVHVVSTVSNTHLGPDSVTTDKILANTILAGDVYLTGGLAALSADLGIITAGTITGATFQTAASGARVTMNASGLTAVDGSANTTFSINSSGAVTLTGTITATGLTLATGTGAGQAPSVAKWTAATLSNNQTLALQSYYTGGTIYGQMLAGYVGSGIASNMTVGVSGSATAYLQFTAATTSGTGEIKANMGGSDRRVYHANGTSMFVRAPNPVDDGTSDLAMRISIQRAQAYSVASNGVSTYALSGIPGGSWSIIGHTAGTGAYATDWGLDGAGNVQIFNRAIGTVTGVFYYMYIYY